LVFPEFSSSNDRSCYPVSYEIHVTKNASNFVISFLFISFQWWVLDLSFRLGMFSKKKKKCKIIFFSCSYVSCLHKSKYSRGLWGGGGQWHFLRHSLPFVHHMMIFSHLFQCYYYIHLQKYH
jgi:hypothetical protein